MYIRHAEGGRRAASWVLPLVVGAVAWLGAYPPMADLPLHEGVAALLVHHGDPAWAPAGLYTTSLGHPQQLVQLCIAAAMLVVPGAIATKLVASLSTAGVVWSTTRLLRHAGRTPWAAALVAPLALGWLYHWGFVTNLAGLALFGVTVAPLDRLADAPSPRRAAIAALLLALTFSAHATSAAAGIVTLFVLVALRRRSVIIALAPAVVVFALALVTYQRERIEPTLLAESFASRVLWQTPLAKLRQLPAFIGGRYEWPTRIAVLVVLGAAVGVFLHARRGSGRATLREHRFTLAAAVLLAVFFALPYSMNYGAFLYVRFLGPAWICIVPALAPRRASILARAAAIGCVTVSIAALLPEIRQADEEHRALAALYPRIARASAVAVVHYGSAPRAAWNAASAGQRVLAERGGRTLFSFVEYPSSPVKIPFGKRWDALAVRVYAQPGDLRPATDLDVVRYVLAHVPDATLRPLLESGFRPDARLVAQAGEWLLFESTHTLAPIDQPLPRSVLESEAETLQSRVYAAVRRSR